jgi:hypothetical protein
MELHVLGISKTSYIKRKCDEEGDSSASVAQCVYVPDLWKTVPIIRKITMAVTCKGSTLIAFFNVSEMN